MMTSLFQAIHAAEYLGISASYLGKLRMTGGGPTFVKLGKRRVAYRKSDLDTWIKRNRRTTTSDVGGR